MQNTGKSRKMLIIGIVAAVVILAAVLVLLLTQCTGGAGSATTAPSTVATDEVPTYQLYWNADRALYDGKSEAGMSSRMPESDGYFHVRFILDGEEVTLKVADRKVINAIDVQSLMGLEFDENGIVIAVVAVEDMPLEKVAWQFYVQSAGGKTIKANSSSSMNGMEVLLEGDENTGVYNVSGLGGELGSTVTPINQDRIYAVQNLAGELTHVFIYERPNYMLTHEADCEHCGKVVTWYEWNKETELPITSGHYQLQNDITTKKQSSMEEEAKICLDLNGFRVDGAYGARVYSLHNVGAELALMDTSEAKTGTLAAHGKGDQGMVVWLRYGVFYLYDGILDGSDATTIKNGTTVALQANTYMYMYGGEIIGGTSTYTYNAETKKYGNGLGGTMLLSGKSKFVMNGGVIRDGYAEGLVTEWNKDGTPKTYQRGSGGNIFMSSGSVMELNGGVIKNGKATNVGGNIHMDGTSELTINGGSIQGGVNRAKGKNGGSMFISTKSTVYLKSGRITGGTSYNCGGNVYLNGTLIMSGGYIGGGIIRNFSTGKVTEDASHRNLFIVNGTFRMYGGTIDGGVQATDASATDNRGCFVGLTTYATIDGGEKSNNNLTLSLGAGGPVQVNVGDLRDSAKIRVKASTGIFTTPTSEKNADNFVSDIESADIHYYQGCIALGRMNCVCGKDAHFGACDGTEYLWAPHTSKTALPIKEGFYYLDNDVTSGSNAMVGDADVHVRLDLNGKTVTSPKGNSARVYNLFENVKTKDAEGNYTPNIEGVSMQLTVTDSVGTGKVVMSENADRDQGGMFWGRYNDSVITIYGGTFDGSASASSRHMGVVIATAGKLNIYGGTILGGTATAGGNVSITNAKGSFTMTGGTITGGTATGKTGGGNVYIAEGATFNLSGGTISGGQGMNGGNIYLSKHVVMNMSGGIVTGGRVDNSAIKMDGGIGGNIYQNGTFTMTGGIIEKGYVRGGTEGGGHGGNLGVYGTVNLLGGVIRDGEAKSAGGNVGTISTDAVLVLDGIRLENGKAGMGGNLAIHVRHGKSVEIEGNTVITGGTATNYGGNISVRVGSANKQAMPLTITGVTIENGTATNYGGNIFLYNDSSDASLITQLITENVTLIGGKAGAQGGNLHAEGYTKVTLNGTTLTGGTAKQGGNLYTLKGEHVITDSVIDKGTAVKAGDHANGGNIFANASKLDLVGTTVKDGVATGNTEKKYPTGGNLYINGDAHVTLDGGTVISGGQTQQNAASWTAGGNLYVVNGTVDINDATVTGGSVNSKGSMQGHNIYICSAGTVNLNGGKIENTVKANQSIYFEGGTFNLNDGEVVNVGVYSRNFASKADVGGVINIKGGKVSGGYYESGANFYLPKSFTLNISGGIIEGGEAQLYAGNIYLAAGSTVNMTGGTISGGKNTKAGNNGGSIYVCNGATFNMSGGTVKNGVTANVGGNFYNAGTISISGDAHITGGTTSNTASYAAKAGNISSVNGTLNISGGVIDGDVGATNSGKAGAVVNLSGKVIINKGKAVGLSLRYSNYDFPATVTIDGTLAEGSMIVIDCVEDTVITSNATVKENLKFFEPLDPEKELVWLTADRDVNGDGTSDLNKLAFGQTYCICGVDSEDPADHLGTCGGELLTWLPWDKTNTLPTTEGNYYLTAPVTFKQDADNDATKEFNTSGTINIDLNGYTVSTSKDLRIFRVRNGSATTTTNIAVTDTSAEKTGKIVHTCTASTLDGGIVWLTQAGHSFSLYGGTLDASGLISNTNGTAIKINNGVVNIYGGTVKGGTTTNTGTNGASIRINAAATLNMTGGTLDGGTGLNWGGILAVYGTANITGGTIKNGTAKSGHNIAVIKDEEATPATLNISNATVAGGIQLNNAKGSCVVTLNGKVIIDKTLGNTALGYGLNFGGVYDSSVKVDMSGLIDGTEISVTANGIFGTGANDTIKGYFSPDVADEIIILDGDKLTLGRERCLCGNLNGDCIDAVCNGEKLLWTVWGEKKTLPSESGNYYLGTNVNPSEVCYPATDAKVNLDLNGKTISRGGRVISTHQISNVVLTITDTNANQTGTIKATDTSAHQGMLWISGTNNKLVLIRGTIDGSARTLIRNSGLAVCVGSGNTFNMYGGTVIGGTYKYEPTGTSAPFGGAAIRSAGTTNIYGGTIKGGTSDHLAGGIYVDGGVFTLAGGTIEGGKAANGGAVAISKGEFRLESGTISGGQATVMGGNVYISGGTFKMTGGTVTGGTATNTATSVYGGNIGQEGGTVELLGGIVENGKVTSPKSDADLSGGGNIAANAASGTLTLNGVTVKGGNVSPRGGNIYLFGNGVDMTIAGSTVITGGTANYGGNICIDASERTAADPVVVTMTGGTVSDGTGRAIAANVALYKNAKFVLDNGTITGGTAKGYGGSVLVNDNSKFVMNGGSITGGEAGKGNSAARDGGNVYINIGATFELNNGTVSGGKSTGHGGNFYVAGTLVMNNGTISNGEAGKGSTTSEKNGGNVYVATGATFELHDGTVSGGKSNNSGGNIHVYGTMKMTDGTVKGGSCKNASSYNIGVQGGTLEMSGGKVEGNVTVINSGASHDAKVILSGEPVISGGTLGLKLHRTGTYPLPLITVKGTLGANAKIVISKEMTADGIISDNTAGASAKAFVSQDADRGVYAIDNGAEYPTEVGCLYLGKYGCICGGISGTECAQDGHPKVKWTAWSTSDRIPGAGESASDTTAAAAGNYYLTGDIKVGGEQHYSKAGVYNIDLNGYNITGSAVRLFRMRNDDDTTKSDYALTIGIKNSRTVENGGIISSTKQGAQEGYLVWMTQASQVFNLYSGTLDGSAATTAASKSGGCVNMYGGTFNMYGGEIKGGNATSNGGNVAVCDSDAVFNLYGGTVSGGNANYGGNIATTSKGTANLIGGTVSGGNATTGGGNIYVTANLNLKGTTVQNGTATSTGGNIHVGDKGNMIMTKGLVTGGNAAGSEVKDHENVYCRKGTLDLRGGEIDGFTMAHYLTGEATALKVSGTIKLIDGARNLRIVIDSKVTDKSGCVIQLGKLESGADIGIESNAALFAKSASGYTITHADKAFFTPESSSKQVVFTENGLELKAKSEIWRCVCGGKAVGVGDHKCVDVKWTETATMPTTTGNYILTADIQTAQMEYTTAGTVISIDLNGHSITATNNRVIRLTSGVVFNVTDTNGSGKGNGKIIGLGHATDQGGTVIMSDKSKLNIYGGTFTTNRTNTTPKGGGVLYCTQSGTTITMYNGTVTGGHVSGGNGKGTGGNVWVNEYSTFVMYGGKITDGESNGAHHANVHCKWSNMEVYGGEITGGVLVQSYNDKYSTIKISGDPVIYGEGATSNLRLVWSREEGTDHSAKYPVIQLGKLTKGANIHISDISTARVIAEPAGSYVITDTDAGYFKSDISTTKVVLEDGKLKVVVK